MYTYTVTLWFSFPLFIHNEFENIFTCSLELVFSCYSTLGYYNKTSHKIYLYGEISNGSYLITFFIKNAKKICLCKIAKSMESTAYVLRRLLTSAKIWVQNNMCIRYIFSSNHNVHQSSCGLCLWAPNPF